MPYEAEQLIELLKQTNRQQEEQIQSYKEQNAQLQAVINDLRSTIANLEETLAELQRRFFGISREKTPQNVKEQEAPSESIQETGDTDKVQVKAHSRTRKPKSTRESLYADLPIREIQIPVAEDKRFCPDCGAAMEHLGYKFSREEIRITPAKVERIHYMQETLVCPACREEGDTTIIAAPVPQALLPHSPASQSMVSEVMYMRFGLSLPYYRQEQHFKQMGFPLPRETAANWCICCTEKYLLPIYERMHEELLQREIIHADETPCQVLHEKGREATDKSYMWIYSSGNDGLPGIVLYEYQPGRAGKYPKAFLDGFSGYVQCDGYVAYGALEDVVLVCCLSHCRRKFFEAIPKGRRKKLKLADVNSEAPIQEIQGKKEDLLPAEIGLNYCNSLFQLERGFKGMSAEERTAARKIKSAPVWDQFWKWLDTIEPAGGSGLEKAVNYARNHRETLMNYMKDGRCEISNNRAERLAKSYGIGRKNSLFHNTEKGANASAVIYSLVESAKANNINIYQYLYTVLLYMPDYNDEPAGIEKLLPWSDFVKVHCTGPANIEENTPENRIPLMEAIQNG